MGKKQCLIIVATLLLIGGCSQPGAGTGPGAEACTTLAWEDGMKDMEEEDIEESGRRCDSYLHFKTTAEEFYSECQKVLSDVGCELSEQKRESYNRSYQNPRLGYYEYNTMVEWEADGVGCEFITIRISYDTYSGELHEIEIEARTLEAVCTLVEVVTGLEGTGRNDVSYRLDADELLADLSKPSVMKNRLSRGFTVDRAGYHISVRGDYYRDPDISLITLTPGFSWDKGRLLSEEEAVEMGDTCTGYPHMSTLWNHADPVWSDLFRDMGYEISEKTHESYPCLQELEYPPEDGSSKQSSFFRSKASGSLNAGDEANYTYWYEIDYDTAGKQLHGMKASLRSKEECSKLVSGVMAMEAEAAGEDSLAVSWEMVLEDLGKSYVVAYGNYREYQFYVYVDPDRENAFQVELSIQ